MPPLQAVSLGARAAEHHTLTPRTRKMEQAFLAVIPAHTASRGTGHLTAKHLLHTQRMLLSCCLPVPVCVCVYMCVVHLMKRRLGSGDSVTCCSPGCVLCEVQWQPLAWVCGLSTVKEQEASRHEYLQKRAQHSGPTLCKSCCNGTMKACASTA